MELPKQGPALPVGLESAPCLPANLPLSIYLPPGLGLDLGVKALPTVMSIKMLSVPRAWGMDDRNGWQKTCVVQ